ncbi:hypothetical protein Tco_0699258 [Tanacetum coccineum]
MLDFDTSREAKVNGFVQIAVYSLYNQHMGEDGYGERKAREKWTLSSREDMLLNKAHKIGEMLQEKLEQLAEVERAFVHIDFEFSHVTDLNTKPRSS